jgi:hypothetical protein
MAYFSNKPAPTPPKLLPRPRSAATNKEDEKPMKRKLDSGVDGVKGNNL